MAQNADMGNLYDFNKMAYAKMPPIPEDKAAEKLTDIGGWFSASGKYFMLLCREIADYTVFNFESYDYEKGKTELEDIVKSRGSLLDIVYNDSANGYEFWVRSKRDNEIHMYMLFGCDDFIITI